MKRVCVTLILLIMLGGSSYKAEHLTPNALIAEQLLIQKNYKVKAYKGSIYSYVLTRELLVSMPNSIVWASQGFDPTPYIGKNVDIEKFIVKNHILDHWQSNSKVSNLKSDGTTQVFVYVIDSKAVGGTSFPSIREHLLGGYWSLDGKTLDEIDPASTDYITWSKKWKEKYD